jgi:hypothetical protein
MIKKLSFIFGSRTKALEILFLLRGLKPVVRQGFYPDELPPVEKFCKEEQLHLVTSKFKVLLVGDDFYSNRGIRVDEQHKDGMYMVYISKDEKAALMASYFELVNNHRDLGRLLGYPDCCISHFITQFSSDNPNPEVHSDNPFTNISLRRDDIVLISHFPCSADCAKSIEIGKRHWEALAMYDKDLAADYLRRLSKRADDA